MIRSKWRALVSVGTAALAVIVSASEQAYAATANPLYTTPNRYYGVRPMALGRAFTAVADDQMALYYNPAGLARLQGWSMEILSGTLGWNSSTALSQLEDIGNRLMDSKSSNNDKINVFKEQLGKNFNGRVVVNPYLVVPHFGLALLQDIELNASIESPKDNFIDLSLRSDTEVRTGFALGFLDNKIAIGTAIALHNRVLVDGKIGMDKLAEIANNDGRTTQDKLKDFSKAGVGATVDVGILLAPWETWRPTLGASVLNLGDAALYRVSALEAMSNSKPEPLSQSINVGVSLTPLSSQNFLGNSFLRASADLQDINQATAASKKLCLGLEGGLEHLITGQLGYSEGYFSAGFEMRLYILNLRFATYRTERGFFASNSPERRYLAGIKVLL